MWLLFFFFSVSLSNTSLQQGTYPDFKTQEIKLVFVPLIVPGRRLDHHGELISLTPLVSDLSLRGHHRGHISFLPIITPLKWMILPRPCTVHNRQLATGVKMAPLLTSKSLLEPHYRECDSLMITASLWAIMGIETSASFSWNSHRAMKWNACSIFLLLDHLNERKLC